MAKLKETHDKTQEDFIFNTVRGKWAKNMNR